MRVSSSYDYPKEKTWRRVCVRCKETKTMDGKLCKICRDCDKRGWVKKLPGLDK
jgi:rRNA maturation endonuclease Nob1